MNDSLPAQGKLALLVAGGPAPGINGVLGSAILRARMSGIEVLGIRHGFRPLMHGDLSQIVPLELKDVTTIHFRGGSYLGTSRGSPLGNPEQMAATARTLDQLGIDKLITIGGDGTAYVACQLATHFAGRLRVVHVPKTIDNDIDLPDGLPTFGFHTARQVGVGIVHNLMVDAKTTGRWYFVVAQGRKTGHLALAIGKAAGATLSIIPEEFDNQPLPLRHLVDILVGSILKRLGDDRPYGVAMIAEGVTSLIPEEDLLQYVARVPKDAHGNVQLAAVNLGDVLEQAVAERLDQLGVKMTVAGKEVGYELRSADPNPFDMEYTRELGYVAARYILAGGSHAMVSMQNNRFVPIPFQQMMDPITGHSRVRTVDVRSDGYRIARMYMLRMYYSDLESPQVERLERALGIPAERLRAELAESLELEDRFWRTKRGTFSWGPLDVSLRGSERSVIGEHGEHV